MPVTLKELTKLIQDAFPGADVSGVVEKADRISGLVVWNGFAGKNVSERNQLVTRSVRNPLGLRGMNVGVIHPLAPGERL